MNPTRVGHWRRLAHYIGLEYLTGWRASLVLYFWHPLPFPSFDRCCILGRRNLDVVSARLDPQAAIHPSLICKGEPRSEDARPHDRFCAF